MTNKELIKRVAILKANPKLANVLPQSDILALLGDVVKAFGVLQEAVETNKIKGEPGANGITPRPGVDYPTYSDIDTAFTRSLSSFETAYSKLERDIKARLATVKDGKDAVITDSEIDQIARLAVELIELPDFTQMMSTEVDAFWSALEIQKEDITKLREDIENRAASTGGSQAVIARKLAMIRDVSIEGVTDGQTLVYHAASKTWRAGIASGSSSPLTTKGDVFTYSTTNDRLAVGIDGQVLSSDSTQATGLKWIALAGGGDMLLAATQTVSALKTYLAGTLGLRNVANTFTSFFTNANTVSRTYTLKDADGTIAFTSDITGTNSGTNTGDQTTIVGITGTKAQFDTAVTDGNFMYIGDAPTAHTHLLAAGATDVTITAANLNSLDDGVDSTLHFHATDRARANHTGSQLASTISDFASTVLSTLLTGISFVTGTAVVATDSVLVALGKLQKQNTDQDTAIASKVASVSAGTNTTVTGTATAPIVNAPTMTATVGGAVPTPPNNTTTFLRGDGTFAAPAGGGDVTGPALATDNAIARFDTTTGKLIQNSATVVDDSGNIGVGITAPSAQFHARSATSAAASFEKTGANAGTFSIYNDGFANIVGPGTSPNRRFAFYDQMGAGNGNNVATPAFTNFNDTNTGIYFPSNADEIAIATGGVQRVLVNTTNVTSTLDIIVPDEVYDATAWNGSLEVPTKNAVRDKVEAMDTTIAAKVASVTAGTNTTVTGTATAPIINAPTMTSTVGGAVPTPPNIATQFLNGQGVFSIPAGSGTVTNVSSANADATVATQTTTPVITVVQTPALRSATTTVNVAAATAPTTGQVLTATSSTAATWQTPSGGGGSATTIYIDQTPDNGAYGLLAGAVNGVNAVFTVSQGSYTTGTLSVYLNGQLLTQGASNDYQETTPGSGTFTFITAPATGSIVTSSYQKNVTVATAVSGQATVDFGAVTVENSIARVTVNTAAALTASIIMVSPSGVATATHDTNDYQWDNISGYVSNIVNGVSFDIVGVAPNGSFGTYVFNYVIQ